MDYSVTNVVANGWLNIEDDEHLIYSVKGNSSLYVLVFNKKVQNQLIGYLQGQKLNLSSSISRLKGLWTENLKAIQPIFHPNQLHSCCHFPREVAEYLYKQLNNVKERFIKYGENDFYTKNYPDGGVQVGWKNEFIQSITSIILLSGSLIEWNK